jgi:hypothetical protein
MNTIRKGAPISKLADILFQEVVLPPSHPPKMLSFDPLSIDWLEKSNLDLYLLSLFPETSIHIIFDDHIGDLLVGRQTDRRRLEFH